MAIDRYATFAQALVRAREKLPFDVHPIDVLLKNGISATALVQGDLVMLDTSSTGVDSDGNYTQVIAPTAAGNLKASGSYHLVCQGSVAAGTSGWFRLLGDTKLNLNASSATIGALLHTRSTNMDATTAVTWGGKCIGSTKIATTTGVVRCFFDGRGLDGPEYICIQANAVAGAVSAANSVWVGRSPYAFTVTELRASLLTAGTGVVTVDVNESGTTIISTKLTIDANETSSLTAATAYVLSDAAIANDAQLSIDVDSIGGGANQVGLTVLIFGYR